MDVFFRDQVTRKGDVDEYLAMMLIDLTRFVAPLAMCSRHQDYDCMPFHSAQQEHVTRRVTLAYSGRSAIY